MKRPSRERRPASIRRIGREGWGPSPAGAWGSLPVGRSLPDAAFCPGASVCPHQKTEHGLGGKLGGTERGDPHQETRGKRSSGPCAAAAASALRCASDSALTVGVRPVRMRGFRCCRGEASGASGVRVRLVGASCPGAASGRGSRDTGSSRDGGRPGLPLLGARPRAIPCWRLHDKDTEVPRRQATSWPERLNLPPQRFWWLSVPVKGTKAPCVARWVVAAWVEQSPWLCSLAIPGASGPEHPLAHLASDRALSPRLCLSFCVRLSTFPFSCCPWAEFQSPFFSFLTD